MNQITQTFLLASEESRGRVASDDIRAKLKQTMFILKSRTRALGVLSIVGFYIIDCCQGPLVEMFFTNFLDIY